MLLKLFTIYKLNNFRPKTQTKRTKSELTTVLQAVRQSLVGSEEAPNEMDHTTVPKMRLNKYGNTLDLANTRVGALFGLLFLSLEIIQILIFRLPSGMLTQG